MFSKVFSQGHSKMGLCNKDLNEGHAVQLMKIKFQLARRLKLKTLPQCSGMSGGAMVEHMALGGDPYMYSIQDPLSHRKDCDFGLSGIKGTFLSLVNRIEEEQGM